MSSTSLPADRDRPSDGAGSSFEDDARSLLEEAERSAEVGSWEWNLVTGTLRWSRQMYQIVGLDPDANEIDLDAYRLRLHPDDRDRHLALVQAALDEAGSFAHDHRIVRPDGEVRVVHGRGRVETAPDGSPLRMIGSAQDVTERDREHRALRFLAEAGRILASSLDYEETLEAVARLATPHLADWVCVDVVVPGGFRRLAVAAGDPRRQALADELARDWPPRLDDAAGVAEALRSAEPEFIPVVPDGLIEARARGPGHVRLLHGLGVSSVILVPMVARERVLGVVALVHGPSGRVFTERDFQLARELAERAALAIDNARLYREATEASRARDDLLAIVSHDLRNPLSAVLAGAALLKEMDISEERRPVLVDAIHGAALRMDRLTRDLLDAARLEDGALELTREPLNPEDLVREAVSVHAPTAEESGIALVQRIAPDLGAVVGDRARLLQVLDNLLINALRHTPSGGTVTVWAEAGVEGGVIGVADTGPGVTADLMPHLFDRYRQGRGDGRGSAGLGLPIARGLVRAHGGDLTVESRPGEGAEFRFTLPGARP